MTPIIIDPAKPNIGVQVTSQSLHAIGFQISVVAADGNTVTEEFTGDTKANNPFIKTLNNAPATYKGSYIRGTFTVTAPDETDCPYSVLFAVTEAGAAIQPDMPLTGITTNGTDTTGAIYQIN